MRRAGIITLWVLSGILVVFALVAFAAFYTPPGRTAIKTVVETQIGNATNSTARIGRLGGALPGEIRLEDIELTDADGAWLTVDEFALRWRPLALLRSHFVIDEATITGGYLRRGPPEGDESNDDVARQFSILDEAPHVDVRALTIDTLRIDLADAPQVLNGKGALRLDGPDIMLRLSLASESGQDTAEVSLGKSPQSDRFYLEAVLNSDADGAIASLLDLGGPLRITAAGDSPVDAAELYLQASIGAYGDVTAKVLSDFDGFEGADFDLAFDAGARFEGIEELAAPVSLQARYDVRSRGGGLTIKQLSSAIGEIDGAIGWRAPRGFVQTLDININARLDAAYRPGIQTITGNVLALQGELNWRRAAYALSANVVTPLGSLALTEGSTDLRQRLSGDLVLDLNARDSGPALLVNGVALNAKTEIDFDDAAIFESASLTTNDGSRFIGAAAYSFQDGALQLDGDILATPALLTTFAPNLTVDENVAGDIALSGPLERFTLDANLETPTLSFNNGALPPMTIKAALAGLPRLPNGDITARASNEAPRRLDAQLRSSQDGTIRLPRLSYGGRGFALDGSAEIDPSRQTLVLDLTYNGENEAQPWPGFIAIGDFQAAGVLSRDGALNRMNASATNFTLNEVTVSGIEMQAEGPPGAIRLSVASDLISTPQTGAITDLTAAAQIDSRASPKLTILEFDALIRDNRARLTEPVRLDFADGATIENLRLGYGRNGSLSLDGAFSERRWQADAVLANINIPDADGQISGELRLDTDAQTPALGDFQLRSLLLNEEDASISIRALWNGETLRLTDQGDGDLTLDIRAPMQLTISPRISIETEGALNGRFQYDGDVQALAAYMPPVLQTIEGDLNADFSVSGTLRAPALSGEAALTGGAYTEIESGFSLAGLHAEAQAAYGGERAGVTFKGGGRGAGQTSEDTLTFEGALTLGEAPELSITVNLDQAAFSAFPVDQVRADGTLRLAGPLDALKAEGDISITELDAEIVTPETSGLVDIEVIPYNDETMTPEELLPEERSNGLEYAIRVRADDRIFIRGRGLESEWAADVNTVNGREQPLILGSMTLRRGWLDFSGRRFDLTRGAITFDAFAPNNPLLDIRAEYSTGDGVTAAIIVSGRASEPDIELTSTPTLPSEDVMALILFGKPAQDLSAFESLQIAEALASLGGIGPFGGEGLTGRLRQSIGLDLLNVDIDPENGGGSLTVGKYVADGVFVSATQDAQGREGAVSVTYEITDNIIVETELEQDGDQTLSANWKKDF